VRFAILTGSSLKSFYCATTAQLLLGGSSQLSLEDFLSTIIAVPDCPSLMLWPLSSWDSSSWFFFFRPRFLCDVSYIRLFTGVECFFFFLPFGRPFSFCIFFYRSPIYGVWTPSSFSDSSSSSDLFSSSTGVPCSSCMLS
jgi:hypothetical protein